MAGLMARLARMSDTNATPRPRPVEYPAMTSLMLAQKDYDYVRDEAARRGVSKAEIMREGIALHRRYTHDGEL